MQTKTNKTNKKLKMLQKIKSGLQELDGEKNENMSLGGKVVSDKRMDVPLGDSEIWGKNMPP